MLYLMREKLVNMLEEAKKKGGGLSCRVGDSQSDDWISQNKASRSSREIRHRND